IKLVNINIPDIIEGKPSIVLGLIWTIILHFHIEELANSLAFSSRQSSMESLASIDSCSTIDSSSSRRSGTLHTKFKLSAKKALLLWAREQCQKAGANISIKDFKSSWRSGLAFLAILNSLRPDLVDLQKTKSRTNRENLEEAFRTAEHELKIPRLLEPEDVDINDPDDKSIMTYVAQFLQYSKDLPVSEEEMQGNLNQKVKGVTSWLTQAEQELEGSTGEADKESYEEKFHAFQTFVTTFNEQKRPIMPLLTAMRKTTQLTEDQVRLKEAWNKVTSKIREYKVALDLDLPSPLDGVGVWLQKIEPVLGEEIAESQDHEEVAGRIRDTLHLLKSLMEEMDVHWQTLQKFPNKDENGATRVPQEKMDELKRRFTSVRVTAKYHGIKLEYQESKHSVQALICAVNSKLNTWKKKYGTKESVKLLQLDWHVMSDWSTRHGRLNEAGNFLMEVTNEQTSSQLSEELKKLNRQWADFIKRTTFVTVRVANIPVVQQAVKLNVEEAVPAVQDKQDLNETEVLKSYRESKSVFEVQLKKNRELILSEFPEDMVDTSVLRIKCQELQAAQEETETFWFEFEIQSSQLKGNMREPETKKRINHEWRELKPSLQARLKSMETTVGILVPVEIQVTQLSDLLEQYQKKPKTLKRFTVTGADSVQKDIKVWHVSRAFVDFRLKSMETTVGILVPVEIQVTQLSDLLEQYQKKPKTLKRFTVTGADSVQKDIKELQERIQRHIVNSSVLEKPGSPSVAGLDSRDQLAIHKIVLVCKKKLQKMIYSIHDSEVVMKTLEAFLASLRTAENDIDRLQAAPSADVVALRKSKVKLEVSQKDINFMRDKAIHIDELLNKAEICLQEAESSKAMTCQQMIAVLSQKLEDTKEFIMKHEQNLQQEVVLRPILVRKEDLIKNLWEAQQKTDSEGLKEPTLPALLQRLKSMETAVGFLVPLDNEVAQLSDSLDQFKKKPKTLKRFTMPGAASVQKDLKELQRRIQRNIRNSSAFEKLESPAAAGLDPRDQQAIQSIVLVCKNKLEEMDHSVYDSEVAMKTLEAFLASLRTAENDIDRLQAAPSSDVVSLCKSKVELEAIQQDINFMRDKAVHIDELLNKAEIRLQEAEFSKGMTCQQMIAVLSQKLEDTREFIMKHEQNLQQEEVLRTILVKKNALMTRLQEVQQKTDSEGLKEPTLPALQQRLRSLKELRNNLGSFEGELLKLRETANQLVLMSSEEKAKHLMDLETLWEETERSVTDRLRILEELENQMRSCEGDLQRLRERANQIPPTSREEETMSLVDLDTLWEETERTVTEGQEQCSVLMGLLKKFQGYRSDLSNTLQRAETTISEQASYMGKDNLHQLIEKVGTMKEELSGSSDHIDEIRTVCRQLQSQLKKIQSCKDTAFESEADSLVDRWLDVTEKTDIYLDNIKCGLTLWEKLISSASDIEEWTAIKLGAFSEHHRFRNQQEITDLEYAGSMPSKLAELCEIAQYLG
ncbi:UNVERIFIED_CONTAM: hypothetical protein FKN15_007354, partial [Acipenser sinensis]